MKTVHTDWKLKVGVLMAIGVLILLVGAYNSRPDHSTLPQAYGKDSPVPFETLLVNTKPFIHIPADSNLLLAVCFHEGKERADAFHKDTLLLAEDGMRLFLKTPIGVSSIFISDRRIVLNGVVRVIFGRDSIYEPTADEVDKYSWKLDYQWDEDYSNDVELETVEGAE